MTAGLMHHFDDYLENEYDLFDASHPAQRNFREIGYPASENGYGFPGDHLYGAHGLPMMHDYPDAGHSSDEEYPDSGFTGNRFLPPRMSRSLRDGMPHGMRGQRPPAPDRPLKIVCIGPNFRVGGVRQHALSLARFLDPSRAAITEFLVTDCAAAESHAQIDMPAPVVMCDAASLERASQNCDVMLMWGDGFNRHEISDRPVRIFLAHGETQWTRKALEASSDVVDHVIAVSQRVHDRVCAGFPTTTILNGVDTGRLGQSVSRDAFRAQFAFRPDDFVVGSIGRFTREKQFDLLIQAIETLPPNFKLLLVGSGRREAELLQAANCRIPGRFVFVPANNYLGNYFAAMDAFGLVSAHEGFGLVIAEAMMCRRPVFVTNVGCVPEIICDRVNGVVVDPDVNSIASAISLMHSQPQWAKGLADQGHAFADQHLHAARMAAEYEDLMCELVFQQRAANSELIP